MTPYQRAELWGKIELVAQAILDQAKRQDLSMVANRHAYLRTLLDQMEPPRVIVFVEGGLVQGARSSIPVNLGVLDHGSLDTDDEGEIRKYEELEAKYDALPEAIY